MSEGAANKSHMDHSEELQVSDERTAPGEETSVLGSRYTLPEWSSACPCFSRHIRPHHQTMLYPPLTDTVWPVIQPESGEANNRTIGGTSAGSPTRPTGYILVIRAMRSASAPAV